VKSLLQNPIFRFFSGVKLAAVLLAIFAVAAGVATWIESYYAGVGSTQTGRAAAYDLVYDAGWFNLLLIVLFVNLTLNLVRRLAKRRQPLGYLLVHVGMLVILIGAGMTRYMGYEGYLRIREGQANNMVSSAKTYAVVRAGNQEASFPVRLYRPGKQNDSRSITLDGQTFDLKVEEWWPRFARRMVPGENGVAMVGLGAMDADGGLKMHTLYEGDHDQIGPVPVHFHAGELPPTAEATSRYGEIRVRVDGETCRLVVTPAPGELGTCNGWSFTQLDFQSNYHTTEQSDPEGPLINPMVKLRVTAPNGANAERVIFALHPEFAMMHEEATLLEQVDMLYELNNGLDIARQGDAVVMRATFPLKVEPMVEGGETRAIPAGEVVAIEKQRVYVADNGLRLVPSEVETSLVSRGGMSDNPNAPSATRISVSSGDDYAEAFCIRGAGPQRVELGGRTLKLSYGPVMSALPYRLYLEDFLLVTYPGSENPASYESHVVLEDEERGISGQKVRIWMNHPLNHRGTKHFQSSYDQDRQGTVLSINRDPGKMPTYLGYAIISLGFFLVMGRIIGDRIKGRNVGAALAVLALAATVMIPTGAMAQHDSASASPPPRIDLSPQAHEAAAQLIVQDFRGRMKPLDTLAKETAIKVTKKSSFEGRDPLEVFLGFAVHPSQWYHYPCIAVHNNGVKGLLKVTNDTHHVSLAHVLEGGSYILNDDVEKAHRTPANQRSKTQQKLITFDERVHILYSALQGSELRLFPIPGDPGNKWQAIEAALQQVEGDQYTAFEEASVALFTGLERVDDLMIRDGLRRTAALQQQYGAEVLPSALRINTELQLNSLKPFVRSTLPYMVGFLLLIIAYFVGLFRRNGAPWRWRDPLYLLGMICYIAAFSLHLYGFVLRWIASGRAPLSNGHESLLFVALAVGLAGLIFELISKTAAAGALSSLLTAVVLGVSMMGAFDPAIGPLVPVLASYWLNIHVTIITASYGFLGLSCLLGMLTLILLIMGGLGKRQVLPAIAKLDKLNVDVMIAGLGLLTIGTLLGGVWANESWGRYWGWDAKETWALVSILIYAMILHFRWIPKLATAYVQAAWSFMAIWSIIMTYFGVNYLLSGLHSYAAGEAATIPTWVIIGFMGMLALSLVAYFGWKDASARLSDKEGLAKDGVRS